MWTDWLSDLNQIPYLGPHAVGVISIAVSGICGAIVGLEREKRAKPAGLRTLILISVGSTVFTVASILIAEGDPRQRGDAPLLADRGRIAAQIVTGVGFLGAGAIFQARRAVVGLTTGASIWVVAAIGVVVGAGYAVAGIVLALLIVLVLTAIGAVEDWLGGPCRYTLVRVFYKGDQGKNRCLIQGVLDEFSVEESSCRFHDEPGAPCVDIRYCEEHAAHRGFIAEIAALDIVESLEEVRETESTTA